jgi:DNA-directed RNA polymerase subunit N (RpoN/RPB10)
MKVICLDTSGFGSRRLKFGKVYNVTNESTSEWEVIDDLGIKRFFLKSRFISLEEFRNKKIEEILYENK